MKGVYLLTGGNVGDRVAYLEEARKGIEDHCGPVVNASSLYETAAWGKEDQENFLNQVLEVQTSLSPAGLLQTILKIEENIGRRRTIKYGPRIIDIDIILFGDLIIESDGLHIPHPRMQYRRFVLVPLAEIAPHKVHPVLLRTMEQLLEDCTDTLAVNKFY